MRRSTYKLALHEISAENLTVFSVLVGRRVSPKSFKSSGSMNQSWLSQIAWLCPVGEIIGWNRLFCALLRYKRIGRRRKQHGLLISDKTSEACTASFLFRLNLGFSISWPGDCIILHACKMARGDFCTWIQFGKCIKYTSFDQSKLVLG